jgi:hypothetical protein
VIINLAVEDDVQRAVLVNHRLMSGGNVHDAQATMAQAHWTINEEAGVVRPAMPDDITHSFEHGRVNALSRPARQSYPVDTAHKEL